MARDVFGRAPFCDSGLPGWRLAGLQSLAPLVIESLPPCSLRAEAVAGRWAKVEMRGVMIWMHTSFYEKYTHALERLSG